METGQGRLLGYVFLENQILSSGQLEKNWAIGTGPLAGLLLDAGSHSRLQLEAGRQWYIDQRLDRSVMRAKLRTRLGPRDNLVADYEWTQIERPSASGDERRISLGWQHYF
jgi:hypothetical protein